MSGAGLAYLDSSAIVKLVLEEPESHALSVAVAAWPGLVSSALAEVEVGRAVNRALAGIAEAVRTGTAAQLEEQLLGRADAVLARIGLLAIEDRILKAASRLGPPALRTLDAIHLATALDLEELEVLVAYDPRLAAAAQSAGLAVISP